MPTCQTCGATNVRKQLMIEWKPKSAACIACIILTLWDLDAQRYGITGPAPR